MIYSQRDPRWVSHELGGCSSTIGEEGCYVAAQAQVATDFGEPIDPDQLNTELRDRGIFVAGCLLPDNAITRIFPDIQLEAVYDFSARPADLRSLSAGADEQVVIEVDFDHNPRDGIQTHFMKVAWWTPPGLEIVDPWFGSRDNFAMHYGTDPVTTIQKVIRYRKPGFNPAPPPPPAPDYGGIQAGPKGCNVRVQPSSQAAHAPGYPGLLPAGAPLWLTGNVTGEAFAGNPLWWRTYHGFFIWAGATTRTRL